MKCFDSDPHSYKSLLSLTGVEVVSLVKHWAEIRLEVLERDGYECKRCGRDLSGDWDRPTVHHLTPRFRGGRDVPENLVCLCEPCHRLIHAYDRPHGGMRMVNIFA